MGYITKVVLLGFCLAFAVYLVGFGETTTGLGLILSKGWNTEAALDILTQNILDAFVTGIFSAAAAVGVAFLTGASSLALWAALAAFVSTFLFDIMVSPLTVLAELGLIVPLNYFVSIIFYLMIVMAIVTFIRGSD